jgi:hypothetical protein
MLCKAYLIMGSVILFGYAGMALLGWEFGNPSRERLTAEARRSATGFRSPYFVGMGYRGGK